MMLTLNVHTFILSAKINFATRIKRGYEPADDIKRQNVPDKVHQIPFTIILHLKYTFP